MQKYLCNVCFILANVYITYQLFSTVPIHIVIVRLFVNIYFSYFLMFFGGTFPIISIFKCLYVICCIISFVKNLCICVFFFFCYFALVT
jgi:hypothetical protein